MKRKLFLGASFVFLVLSATSCEALSDCKKCKTVTTDSATNQVTEGPETEYCGAKLIVIETTPPVTTGTQTTKYQCR
jgi:hypothetical protein